MLDPAIIYYNLYQNERWEDYQCLDESEGRNERY